MKDSDSGVNSYPNLAHWVVSYGGWTASGGLYRTTDMDKAIAKLLEEQSNAMVTLMRAWLPESEHELMRAKGWIQE